MKNTQIKTSLKAVLLTVFCTVLFGFTKPNDVKTPSKDHVTLAMEAEFDHYVSKIIFEDGLNQEEIAAMMAVAELKKGDCETASDYVEHYMNTNFAGMSRAVVSGNNRGSIAAPGMPDTNDSAACGYTALAEVSQDVVGYYYTYAENCSGTYEYDSGYYSGGGWVYARAEAMNCCVTAFVLF